MDEALAGLIIARGPQETCGRREPMPGCLLAASAAFDTLAHARPCVEPGLVIADMAIERASDAVHFVDLDAGPGSGTEADKQPHGPTVIVRKIEEGRIVFAADHIGFSPKMVTRRSSRRSPGLKSVRACKVQRLSHIRRSPGRQTCS